MNQLIRSFLVYILISFSILLNAQNNYSEKIITIQPAHITLKAALKILSDQTACVFSYDPTRINDKQVLSISKCSKLTLDATLQKILPKTIGFKFNGKYVVLQKAEVAVVATNIATPKIQPLTNNARANVLKEPVLTPTPKQISVKEIKQQVDSLLSVKVLSKVNPLSESPLKSDSISVSTATVKDTLKTNLQPILTQKSDTLKITKSKLKPFFELGIAGDNHLGIIYSNIGLNHLYSIISMGSDYYKSYHLGIGVGGNVLLSKYFGANIDLIRYALVGGKSFKINVRTATTQLNPILYCSIGQRLKLYAGPSVYLVKSRLANKVPNTDLGSFIGYSAILGVKIDLTKPQRRSI